MKVNEVNDGTIWVYTFGFCVRKIITGDATDQGLFNLLTATGQKFLVLHKITQKCENFVSAPNDAYLLFC